MSAPQKVASCPSVIVPLGRSVSSEAEFVIEMTPYPMFYSQSDARIRITFANVGKGALLFAEPRVGARTGPAVHFRATRNGEPVRKCRADLSSDGHSLLIPLGPGGDHSEWFWIGCLFEGPGEYEITATVDFPEESTRMEGVVAGSFVSRPIRFIWPEF